MKNLSLTLAMIILVTGLGKPAHALETPKTRKNKSESCKLISKNDAINRAKAKANGKVVSIKLQRRGARSVYRVRVLVGDKRIRNISIKACQ